MSTEPLPEDTVPTWYVNLAVRWSADLDADSKLMLLVLSDIADNETAQIPPQREPSTAQLMREMRRGKDLVIDRRRKLEKAGWLRLTRPKPADMARHVGIKYQVLVPADAEPPSITRPVMGQPAPKRAGGRRGAPESAGPILEADGAPAPRDGRTGHPGSAAPTPDAETGVGTSDPADSDRGRQGRPPLFTYLLTYLTVLKSRRLPPPIRQRTAPRGSRSPRTSSRGSTSGTAPPARSAAEPSAT